MPDFSDPAVIEDIFTYHKPEGDQPAKYEAIRNAAKDFAKVLVSNTPKCADQSAAVRLRALCRSCNGGYNPYSRQK